MNEEIMNDDEDEDELESQVILFLHHPFLPYVAHPFPPYLRI